MAASMPLRKDWQDFKKKHKIGDGAVSGINLGKVLEDYWKNLDPSPKKNLAAAVEVEKVMINYITKYSKAHKDAKYKASIDAFMKDILGECKKVQKDFELMIGGVDAYCKVVLELVSATQQLTSADTTKADLEKYKSGQLRKLGAVGSKTNGVDQTEINKYLGKINEIIDKMPGDSSREFIAKFVSAIIKSVELIVADCKKQGIM